ncbi:MAG TPA: hypothetical protein VHS96_15720 [Bacteroidia bacterium]|jgi:hypothetical protein|nr:hypothetical protein [Bacteroidia bacterium]
MPVKNIDGLSNQQLVDSLQNGGRFVVFYTTVSIVIMTFRLGSDIYFIDSAQKPIRFGWKSMLLSGLLGWWGFPWGPIYTCQSIATAFRGMDVTKEVMAQMARGIPSEEVGYERNF